MIQWGGAYHDGHGGHPTILAAFESRPGCLRGLGALLARLEVEVDLPHVLDAGHPHHHPLVGLPRRGPRLDHHEPPLPNHHHLATETVKHLRHARTTNSRVLTCSYVG